VLIGSGDPVGVAATTNFEVPSTLAKALATGDMLCGGRLSVGIGVGGRIEDYRAVGADPTTQTMRGMAERVAVMKRVWAGEKITESVLPVGPAPVQAGGPPLLVGTIGPKTLRSAAAWADGLVGTTLDLNVIKQNELFDVARAAWAEAGKPKTPPDHVVLVRARSRQCSPPAGAPASAALHELDTRRVHRCDGAGYRVCRQ
jgi:alkanesulfonate monooxygenase SsuD/methylene tetrahydromethanopterin reductase-like flavin-dependent oxidoreductase (luciferase family)